MLDQEDGLGLVGLEPRDEIEDDRNLIDAHARGRLVEHEDRGLERHHHRDFELALIAVRQRRGERVAPVEEADRIEHGVGARDEIGARAPRPAHVVVNAGLGLGREPHVLADAEAGKKVGELKRAPEAEPRALRARSNA